MVAHVEMPALDTTAGPGDVQSCGGHGPPARAARVHGAHRVGRDEHERGDDDGHGGAERGEGVSRRHRS